MESSWRTAQIFLSSQAAGVFEVEIDQQTSNVRCNCPVWKSKQVCKHTRFVLGKIKGNRGKYTVSVPAEVPDDEIFGVMDDAEKFREFILKHGKIEVL